ncbi:MAG: rhodanese-like domain-containing protein [Alphaproteobacteria bacterium]
MSEDNPLDQVTPANGYAGNVSVETCWDVLTTDKSATLIDVRTTAEWAFVGLPDLSSIGKQVGRAEWVSFPTMSPNADFTAQVKAQLDDAGITTEAPVFFLCRSGQRSQGAAAALTAAGYTHCYNVAGGFEGDANSEAHRGTVNGWKVAGLPWVQS